MVLTEEEKKQRKKEDNATQYQKRKAKADQQKKLKEQQEADKKENKKLANAKQYQKRKAKKMNNNNNNNNDRGPPGTPSRAPTRPMTQSSPIDKLAPLYKSGMSERGLVALAESEAAFHGAEAAFHGAEAAFHGSQAEDKKGDNLKLIKDMKTEQLQAVKALYDNGDGDKKPAAKKSPSYSDEMGDKKPAAKKSLSFNDKMGATKSLSSLTDNEVHLSSTAEGGAKAMGAATYKPAKKIPPYSSTAAGAAGTANATRPANATPGKKKAPSGGGKPPRSTSKATRSTAAKSDDPWNNLFKKGDVVVYKGTIEGREGQWKASVEKVHTERDGEDDEPYYSIKFSDSGVLKETVHSKMSYPPSITTKQPVKKTAKSAKQAPAPAPGRSTRSSRSKAKRSLDEADDQESSAPATKKKKDMTADQIARAKARAKR